MSDECEHEHTRIVTANPAHKYAQCDDCGQKFEVAPISKGVDYLLGFGGHFEMSNEVHAMAIDLWIDIVCEDNSP